MRIQFPGIYMQCLFAGISIFFTAMEKSYLPMLVQVVCIPFHAIWCYLFIYVLHFDVNGCAIAVNITYSLCFLGVRAIITNSTDPTVKDCWVEFNLDTFSYIRLFLRLAVSGLLLTCLEVWCSEGIQIMSGLLGV